MNPYDALMTLAEVGVTIASLSAVAGVIQSQRADSRTDPMTIRLFRDVALLGMIGALLAVLPVLLERWPSQGAGPWRACSAVGAAIWIVLYVNFLRQALPAVRRDRLWRAFLLGLAITLLGLGSLIYNTILPSIAAPQFYMVAIVCLLFLAGFDFLIAAFTLGSPPPATQESFN